MTAISVSKDISTLLPGLVLISGTATVGKPKIDEIAKYLLQSWQKLGQQIGTTSAKEFPLINIWRQALLQAKVPIKDCPPSIEAIAKRAAKGGQPFSINSVVDTYNAISMELVLPFGAYDANALHSTLELRLSKGGETFRALGSTENESTAANEIVYADRSDILTRHFLWRQAEKAKITNATNKFVFVCELLSEMGPELVATAQTVIQSKFSELLGAKLENLEVTKF